MNYRLGRGVKAARCAAGSASPLQLGFDEGGGGGFGAIFRYYKDFEFPYVWRFVFDEKKFFEKIAFLQRSFPGKDSKSPLIIIYARRKQKACIKEF